MKIDELIKYGMDTKEIQYYLNKFHNEENIIVVTGEFSAGKSCFINCLLNRKDFLPYGTTECTPVLIDLYEGKEDRIELRDMDGKLENVPYSKENIEKYARFDRDSVQKLLSIEVPVKDLDLIQGTHIIDTPGINTIHKEHEKITDYIIKKADLVIYIFNKVIGKSDIAHINEIRKFSDNIIFILTHIDEVDGKTGKMYSADSINRLMDEAKSQISKGTDCEKENLSIYPIGSMKGFEDRKYANMILSSISDYLNGQSSEKRKQNIKKQIAALFKDAIHSNSIKKEALSAAQQKKEEEIISQVDTFKTDRKKAVKKYDNLMEQLDSQIDRKKKNCLTEFNHHLMGGKEKVIEIIQKDNIEPCDIEKEIHTINHNISEEIRRYIEESIYNIVDSSYDELGIQLNDVVKNFDADTLIILEKPEISELGNSSYLVRELNSVKAKIEETIHELQEMNRNSASDGVNEINEQIHQLETEKADVENKLLQMGAYRPEYEEVEIAGGKQSGAITGRVIGELADMALLFWNPAGAAMGAVDKAKDVATAARYVIGGIGKADKKRREMIGHIEISDTPNISVMLDMLSIGYWTEKAGAFIGETIQPTKILQKEKEEVKEEYKSLRNSRIEKLNQLSAAIFSLQEELIKVDDCGKNARSYKEMENKKQKLEERKRQIEEDMKRAEENNRKIQESGYYYSELNKYFENQKSKCSKLISTIFDEAKNKIAERLTISYLEKIEEFDNIIAQITRDKADRELEINDLNTKINTLSGYEQYIEEWLME